MRKLSLIVIALISFTACNPLDKSIAEELTVEEIKSASEKDSLFERTYKMIDVFKKLNEDDKLAIAKYSDLTYQQFLDYQNFLNDNEFWDVQEAEFEKEWSKDNLRFKIKGVNIIKDWKKKKEAYEKENDPSQYLKIELVGISTEYYEYSGGVEDAYFRFRLTPLKGKIQQATWRINPTAKIDGDVDLTSVSRILDGQGYIYSRPFSGPVTGRYEASYSHRDLAAGKSSKTFLRDYNMNLTIRKVRVNGKNYELGSYDEMPQDVEFYLDELEENGENGIMTEYYLEKVIKAYVDENYIDKQSFISDKSKKIRQEKYPLLSQFHDNYFANIANGEATNLLEKMKDIFKQ